MSSPEETHGDETHYKRPDTEVYDTPEPAVRDEFKHGSGTGEIHGESSTVSHRLTVVAGLRKDECLVLPPAR